MENIPIYPDWKQLKELLDECSTTDKPVEQGDKEKQLSSDKTVSNIILNCNETETDITTNLLNKIKKLEEIIKEQNQIIRVKNAYISVLERKIKKLKEKLSLPEDTTHFRVKDITDSDIDLDLKLEDETEAKTPIQKIADLHQYLQDLHEQVRLLKKRPENPQDIV